MLVKLKIFQYILAYRHEINSIGVSINPFYFFFTYFEKSEYLDLEKVL